MWQESRLSRWCCEEPDKSVSQLTTSTGQWRRSMNIIFFPHATGSYVPSVTAASAHGCLPARSDVCVADRPNVVVINWKSVFATYILRPKHSVAAAVSRIPRHRRLGHHRWDEIPQTLGVRQWNHHVTVRRRRERERERERARNRQTCSIITRINKCAIFYEVYMLQGPHRSKLNCARRCFLSRGFTITATHKTN